MSTETSAAELDVETTPPGGDVATPPGGVHHPDTPVWDELADRWAELVESGALVPLVLSPPELDELDEPGGSS